MTWVLLGYNVLDKNRNAAILDVTENTKANTKEALGNAFIGALAVDTAGNVYASTEDGRVFEYVAADKKWYGLSEKSVDGSIIVSMAVTKDNRLYVGTQYGTLYQYNFKDKSWVALGSTDREGF